MIIILSQIYIENENKKKQLYNMRDFDAKAYFDQKHGSKILFLMIYFH